MPQTIEIDLPDSPTARDEVLSFLVEKGVLRPEKYALLTSSSDAQPPKKQESFSSRWAGCFTPAETNESRYRALTKKYL